MSVNGIEIFTWASLEDMSSRGGFFVPNIGDNPEKPGTAKEFNVQSIFIKPPKRPSNKTGRALP
jgi:hypothetical protein